MRFLSFQRLGENRDSPRVWIESQRLSDLGFPPGTPFTIEPAGRSIRIRPAEVAHNHVSRRMAGGTERPIIDIANRSLLEGIADFREIKVAGSFRLVDITPSARAFSIQRRLGTPPPYRTVEVFAGGGMMSAAINGCRDFRLIAGVEMNPKYADVWQRAHPEALLVQSDIRRLHPVEIPTHDVLVAAIPCTDHSSLGRAKKSLAGKPELGTSGDLFVSLCEIIAFHLPLACVFENVPLFGTSLAGQILAGHLRALGYSVDEMILDPFREWGEPQDRKRWILVATLQPGFRLKPPGVGFAGTAAEFLDPLGPQDAADAARIARSIESLRRHNRRHARLGHGFRFTTITHNSTRVPTLVRSYHKINTGPFVETPFGPRLLRKHEAEKLMGCEVACSHYATAIEILGQGVQTRVFRSVLTQLAEFLAAP